MALMVVLNLTVPAHADTVTAVDSTSSVGIIGVESLGGFAVLTSPSVSGAAPGTEVRTLISFDRSDFLDAFDVAIPFDTATLNIDYLTVASDPASWEIYAYTAASGAFAAADFAPPAASAPFGLLPGGPIPIPGSAGTISVDVAALITELLDGTGAFLVFNIRGAISTTNQIVSDPGIELTSLAPVPLPGALPLFLVGLAAMGAFARRRRSGLNHVTG